MYIHVIVCYMPLTNNILFSWPLRNQQKMCNVLVLSYRDFTCSFMRLQVFIFVPRSLAPTTKRILDITNFQDRN